MKRLAALALTAAAIPAFGYYHFLRYQNRDGRWVPLAQKFDLNALPNKTVHFFLTNDQPSAMAAGDSTARLLSQLRAAARHWNEVETSELRLRFGGVTAPGLTAATPGIDVIFDELPPGVIAVGGPTSVGEPGPGASFVAIQRSTVILPRSMTELPSWSEATFLTLVHELGHALGLQHSLASSAMATRATRAATRANPLAADDIAGLSVLYPTRAFQSSLGSLSGRVTIAGANGAALASVVALNPHGAAVGALTHADGTYRIDGLPPGQYIVYAHPLPPQQTGESSPADIRYPLDPDRNPVSPSPAFDLQFFPGVREASSAGAIPVTAGAAVEGVNFNVFRRVAALSLFNVVTYGFPGQIAIRPAPVNQTGSRNFFVATGNGLMSGANAAAGLRASVLGGTTGVTGVRAYSPGFLQFDLGFSEQSGTGVRHLAFSTPTDVYVQPSAFALTNRLPPQIASVAPVPEAGLRAVAVTGTGLSANSTILFDGQVAPLRSFDETAGRAIVSAPSGSAGQRAAVVAIADGLNSAWVQGDDGVTQTLEGSDGTVNVSPLSLPAGSDAMVEVTGFNTSFADGQVSLGFGSSDIFVRRIWTLSPNRLLAQVSISAQAAAGPVPVTAVSGLQTMSVPGGFSVTGANPRQPSIFVSATNPHTGVATAAPGTALLLQTANGNGGAVSATLGERPLAVAVPAPGVLVVQIPAGTPAGPAVLRAQIGGEFALPIVVQIEEPLQITQPPAEARIGETLTLTLNGLGEPNSLIRPRVSVTIGGVEHLATLNVAASSVSVAVLPSVPAGPQPVTVTVDGRTANGVSVAIR